MSERMCRRASVELPLGVLTCRAVSDYGDASVSATVRVQPTDALMLDTQHPESWNWVQDWESRVPIEPLVVEPERVPPRFTVQLPQLPDVNEGDPVQVMFEQRARTHA